MKQYQTQLVNVIAEIHYLYDKTKDLKDTELDQVDKEFVENLAVTVEHYFKDRISHAERKSG